MAIQTSFLRNKVSRRIFLLFVSCVLLPTTTIALLAFREVSGHLQTQANAHLRQMSKAAGMAIFERLLLLEADLTRIKTSDSDLDESGASPGLRERLSRRFSGIALYSEGARPIPFFGNVSVPSPLSEPQKLHVDSGHTLVVARSLPDSPARVYILRAVSPGDHTNSYLVGQVNTAYLWGILEDKSSDDPELCILDDAKQLLYCSLVASLVIPPSVAKTINQGVSGHFGWLNEGTEYHAGFWSVFLKGRFLTPKWTVVSAMSTAHVLGPARAFQKKFALVILLAFLLALLLSITQIRRNLEPLQELQRATRQIGERNFDVRVSVRSGDEFEELAGSFNAMADQIAKQFYALEVEKGRAEAATIAKTNFLTNMSHEIRTPLTAILGFTEQLLETYDATAPEALITIRRNGDHLLAIINDILDVSKIEEGRVEIERVRFSPIELVESVVLLMAVRSDAKGLELGSQYESEIPASIEGDPRAVKQILVNLVGNAIKFTERGYVKVRVRLVPGDEPRIHFAVADTGIGIPEGDRERLFRPFEQADNTTARKYGGTGLGLAISKHLVELLGGSIDVRSEPERGSTFTVEVPTGSLEGVEMVCDPSGRRVLQSSAHELETAASSRLPHACRILVVEDSPDTQRLIHHTLHRAGAEVELAENGQIALELVLSAIHEDNPFDLILMDMQMPVMDGYEATRRLREEGCTSPIIALTAHAMSGDRDRCLEAGCNDFLTKPIDREQLAATLSTYLQDRKSPRDASST